MVAFPFKRPLSVLKRSSWILHRALASSEAWGNPLLILKGWRCLPHWSVSWGHCSYRHIISCPFILGQKWFYVWCPDLSSFPPIFKLWCFCCSHCMLPSSAVEGAAPEDNLVLQRSILDAERWKESEPVHTTRETAILTNLGMSI